MAMSRGMRWAAAIGAVILLLILTVPLAWQWRFPTHFDYPAQEASARLSRWFGLVIPADDVLHNHQIELGFDPLRFFHLARSAASGREIIAFCDRHRSSPEYHEEEGSSLSLQDELRGMDAAVRASWFRDPMPVVEWKRGWQGERGWLTVIRLADGTYVVVFFAT